MTILSACRGPCVALGMAVWAMLPGLAIAQAPPKVPGAADEAAQVQAKAHYESIMADEGRTVGFLDKTGKHKGAERAYRVWVPLDYDPKKTYPVMLYLHDQSSRGIYAKKKLMQSGLPEYIDTHWGKFGWIVVLPQALPDKGWSESQLDLALQVLDRSCREYSIDKRRVYLCGHGEGAEAAMQLAVQEPRRFAAMLGVSGYDSDMAGHFTHLPLALWSYPDGQSRRFVTELIEAGQVELRYTEVEASHEAITAAIYGSAEVLAWLGSHTLDTLGRRARQAPVVEAPKWGNRPMITWFLLDRKGRPVFVPPDLPRGLSRAQSMFRSNRLGLAMEQLQQQLDDGRLKEDEVEFGTKLMADLTAYREALGKAAADGEKHKNYPAAIITLKALAEQFDPQEQAKDAAAKLKKWQADESVKGEIAAGQLYDRGRQTEQAKRYREAAQIYEMVIKKYPDTHAASRATYRLDALKASGKR